MSNLHICTAASQEAVKYVDDVIGQKIVFSTKPRALRLASCCNTPRIARNLLVQVYYDCTMFSCKPLKGCNSPDAKPWWCTRHQVMHSPKTRYWSCRPAAKKETS